MENKNQRVLTIVMVATVTILVIIFAGVTYAFFTANNPEGSTAQIISKSGRMLINYNDGTDNIIPVTNIQPSNNNILVDKTFTLIGSNTTSGLDMPFTISFEYQNTFKNDELVYFLKRIDDSENVVVDIDNGLNTNGPLTQEILDGIGLPQDLVGYYVNFIKDWSNNPYSQEIASGHFKANGENETATFNLKMVFIETGENQDYNKGATFNGKIVVMNQKPTLSDYIAELDLTKNGLEIDKTKDKNLRYVGASPKNYLKFNDEIWRIVGVFNNITTIDENGEEKKESLVKIIRNDSLGIYSWDSSESTKNYGDGVNEWSQADLMTELNTDYINPNPTSSTTLWFNGENNAKNGTYEYSKNIKRSSLDKIANVRWNTSRTIDGSSALNSYNQERSTTLISTPGDNVPRKNTWDGKIALIYLSDYGYASTDQACRSEVGPSNCKNENWLFNSKYQWTLSPYSGSANSVLVVDLGGGVYGTVAYYTGGVRPALFLKSDVVIAEGTGTESDPFILE